MKLNILKRAIEGIEQEAFGVVADRGRPIFDEAINMAKYLLGRVGGVGELIVGMNQDYARGARDEREKLALWFEGMSQDVVFNAGVVVGGELRSACVARMIRRKG